MSRWAEMAGGTRWANGQMARGMQAWERGRRSGHAATNAGTDTMRRDREKRQRIVGRFNEPWPATFSLPGRRMDASAGTEPPRAMRKTSAYFLVMSGMHMKCLEVPAHTRTRRTSQHARRTTPTNRQVEPSTFLPHITSKSMGVAKESSPSPG